MIVKGLSLFTMRGNRHITKAPDKADCPELFYGKNQYAFLHKEFLLY